MSGPDIIYLLVSVLPAFVTARHLVIFSEDKRCIVQGTTLDCHRSFMDTAYPVSVDYHVVL